MIGLPPCDAVTLVTTPADGGCVRTRFFNGMFITREDIETEQRFTASSRASTTARPAPAWCGASRSAARASVCVTPGYGVDCCGNDLVLTTMYEVPIAALLADPAAAPVVCARGPHRMHLLLEYIECPSEPRPVHGDPCAPSTPAVRHRVFASRCACVWSRRAITPSLGKAARSGASSTRLTTCASVSRSRWGRRRSTLSQAPFALSITVAGPNNQSTTVTVPASVDISTTDFKNKYPDLFRFRVTSITVEAVQNAGWSFVGGTVSGQAWIERSADQQRPDAVRYQRSPRSVHKIVFTLAPHTSDYAFGIAKSRAGAALTARRSGADRRPEPGGLAVNVDGA